MTDIKIHFEGPFTFAGETSIFQSPLSTSEGVYVWTFRQTATGSHLIHYVGETTSFGKRHKEHLVHILSMNYGIFDPEDAKNGKCTVIWSGLWRDRSANGPSKLLAQYGALAPTAVLRYVQSLTVFLAPLKVDTQTRRHVEGSIGWNLRNRYPHLRTLFPDDNHIGTSKRMLNARLSVTSSEPIQGLDPEIGI
jgi:hypothetical protein